MEKSYDSREIAQAIKKLRAKDQAVRLQAAQVLRTLGPKAKDAASALVDALKEGDVVFRREAERALGSIGKTAVPALIGALDDQNAHVRESAARALGVMKADASVAVPALMKLLKDEKENDVYYRVSGTLALIGKPSLAPLIAALRDSNARVRERAASTLHGLQDTIGDEAAPAGPHLVPLLRDSDVSVRREAPSSLIGIGPHAQDGVTALLAALKDEDEEVVFAVIRALGGIGIRAKEVVPTLIKIAGTRTKNERFRFGALLAIERIGPEARIAIPVLTEILEQDFQNQFIVGQAAKTLAAIGPAAKSAIPSLKKLLRHPWVSVQVAAAAALWKIEPGDRAAISVLTAALDDFNYAERRDAALALGAIGPSAKAALPALRKLAARDLGTEPLAKMENEEVREAALQAIEKIAAAP